MKRNKITLDSCILFDYLNKYRKDHSNALMVMNDDQHDLYITESVIKEINHEDQLRRVREMIDEGKLSVLKEPQMGTPIPTPIPMNLSHISHARDSFISKLLKERPGLCKHKVLRDFLIAEAHLKNDNDYLLTSNKKDFIGNSDIIVLSYDEFQKTLINE